MESSQTSGVVDKPYVDRDAPEAAPAPLELPTTKPIEKLLKQLGPKAVFGEPVTADAVTVIPVAELRTGFGFGGGRGRSTKPARQKTTEEGGGAGGGGGARLIPRGYISIVGDKARYVPILDVTRLAIGGMLLTAWLAFVLSKIFPPTVR